MNESKISVRYSKALFLLTREKGIVDKVRKDMILLLEISALEDVRDLITSPIIQNSIKKDALTEIFKDSVEDTTYNMILLTVANNREAFLPGIARSFIDRADRFNGITKVTLTTAIHVSDSLRQSIAVLIEKSLSTSVDLKEKQD
ncbi:MAG: ATP synthase F1 subunit delta, partial [Bacteroidales bacterium]|nr:ATP synthase F1 subunit delta [Bacteroidales bacterium]